MAQISVITNIFGMVQQECITSQHTIVSTGDCTITTSGVVKIIIIPLSSIRDIEEIKGMGICQIPCNESFLQRKGSAV